MSPSRPLTLLALVFALFAVVLLVAPLALVARGAQPWGRVRGLWLSGWGFLAVAAGTHFAYRGWGNLVVVGVLLAGAGQWIQREATKARGPKP
ncbi:MAG: hypothetical protein AMXMBFR53_37470 [Gemmatimonadota bacterium]